MNLVLFIILFTPLVFGETPLKGPDRVDLTYMFKDELTQRQAGSSCHVFAATALIEATCFKILGKHIDISEAYLFNRHLSAILTEKGSAYFDAEKNVSGENLGGGYPQDSLARFLKGDVCSEREFPLDWEFINNFENLATVLKQDYEEAQEKVYSTNFSIQRKGGKIQITPPPKDSERELVIKVMERDFHRKAAQDYGAEAVEIASSPVKMILHDDLFKKAFEAENFHKKREAELSAELKAILKDKVKKDQAELLLKLEGQLKEHAKEHQDHPPHTKDSQILECLKHPMEIITAPNPTQKDMAALLADKTPFNCIGTFDYGNGIKGKHVVSVVGYKQSIESKDYFDFRVRDSNRKFSSWGWFLKCDEIVYLQRK